MHGARAVQNVVIGHIAASWVAWIPMLDDDERPAAVDATSLVHTAPQFWDGQKLLGHAIAGKLGFPTERPAWDIYLFYPPGATWADGKPDNVLAQIGGVVVATPGTLPPLADQSRLAPALAGHAIVVGEQANLDTMLAEVTRAFTTRAK